MIYDPDKAPRISVSTGYSDDGRPWFPHAVCARSACAAMIKPKDVQMHRLDWLPYCPRCVRLIGGSLFGNAGLLSTIRDRLGDEALVEWDRAQVALEPLETKPALVVLEFAAYLKDYSTERFELHAVVHGITVLAAWLEDSAGSGVWIVRTSPKILDFEHEVARRWYARKQQLKGKI